MPKNYIEIEKSWLRVVDWGFLNLKLRGVNRLNFEF